MRVKLPVTRKKESLSHPVYGAGMGARPDDDKEFEVQLNTLDVAAG